MIEQPERQDGTIIRMDNVSKVFADDQNRVLAYKDIDFEVRRGEFLCLLGPSGCGKTTLLRAVAGTEPPTSGRLHIDLHDANEGSDIAMVFQNHGLFPWMTLEKNLHFILKSSPLPSNLHATIVDRFISKVGLAKFRKFYPHQLSGGMCQRVNLIRAFVVYPQVLLMDEPFVFLDYQNRYRLMGLLLELWAEQHQTIMFVTHNINEAVLLGDRVLLLTSSPGTVKECFDVPFERPRDLTAVRKDPRFSRMVGEISEVLSEEVEKASRQEEEHCLLGNVKKAR